MVTFPCPGTLRSRPVSYTHLFARKHNSTEFQAFIAEHETDFIRFKTNLLLEDAGKDPIKRAEPVSYTHLQSWNLM